MTRRLSLSAVFATSTMICSNISLAYEDDDLLCRPGWSPDLYYQQIWQQNNQQQISMIQYQYSMANAAAEQRSREIAKIARQARQEKAARKREETIAKNKAENARKAAATSTNDRPTKTASKPAP